MSLHLDVSPQAEAKFKAAAKQNGIEPAAFFEKIVLDYLPPMPSDAQPPPAIDAENAAAIAMLNQWIAEDATDDPEEIRKADEEVAELRRNLNANRAATGERLVSR